jgi:hypothetical protein
VQLGLVDIFLRSTHSSHPKILVILEESLRPTKKDIPPSQDVLNLLESNDFGLVSDGSDSE